MRKLAFLLILVGMGIAVLLPWAQLNFFNDEIKRFEVEGLRENGSVEAVLDLYKSDNQVRIRLFATYLVGAKLPPLKVPVFVKLSDKAGTLLATIVSFPTSGIESGPEEPKQRGSQAIEVEVENDGPHAISITLAPNENDGGIKKPDVKSIEVVFIRNAGSIDNQYRFPGFALAMLGFYLLIRSRGRKATPPKPRWGRGD